MNGQKYNPYNLPTPPPGVKVLNGEVWIQSSPSMLAQLPRQARVRNSATSDGRTFNVETEEVATTDLLKEHPHEKHLRVTPTGCIMDTRRYAGLTTGDETIDQKVLGDIERGLNARIPLATVNQNFWLIHKRGKQHMELIEGKVGPPTYRYGDPNMVDNSNFKSPNTHSWPLEEYRAWEKPGFKHYDYRPIGA
jgi:hypothetical protein